MPSLSDLVGVITSCLLGRQPVTSQPNAALDIAALCTRVAQSMSKSVVCEDLLYISINRSKNLYHMTCVDRDWVSGLAYWPGYLDTSFGSRH